ncbi:Phenolic glucoside malonyltransferase [Melia azedarach]|uniref:Phenolic glucoside malonyltransferase n=1 Tax=Melia azedarach TaxID=155640 RepID=A0ACC1X7M7_MELAZ|nr:Phenolic glucoside malonyltransferase [Melia azedarach]
MAAKDNGVKIHEVTRVTPSSHSTTAFPLPLTYFDAIWFRFAPVERLFFYETTELTCDFFNSEIVPKLKHSLSLTLLHYLPLAGSIMWPEEAPKPAIYYFPNDGVSVTVAESDADFNFLSGNEIREAVKFHPLIPQLPISDDKAEVMAIQITLFPNEGFSIGISCHHAALDGKSSTMFIKSWAYICKQLINKGENPSLLPELTPFFDRTVIKDPNGLDMVHLHKWMALAGSDPNTNKRSLKVMPSLVDLNNLVRATFELTGEDIKKLRDRVLSVSDKVNENEVKQSKRLHLSSFVLALAYTFVCVVKSKREEGNRNVIFGFAADYRSRLHPPIPDNYFGNCVGRLGDAAKVSDFMEENGVAFVAEKLSDLIKDIDRDVEEGSEEKMGKIMELIKQGATLLTVAGSTRFNVYGSDFGWGRPKRVEIVSIDRTAAVSLADRRDGGGGVEVGVALEKQQMEAFVSHFAHGLKDNN